MPYLDSLEKNKGDIPLKKGLAVILVCIFINLMGGLPEKAMEQTEWIQQISVSGEKGMYEVKGKVSSEYPIFYTVEDGHQEFISNQNLKVVNGNFTVQVHLDKKQLPVNGTVMIYFMSANKETISVVLEVFS